MAQVTLMQWLLLIPVVVYFFIILFIARKLSSVHPFIPEKRSYTKVSVVVACRNEETSIPYLLSDIISQDHPPENIEVIIVDDWSEDKTSEVALSYAQIKNLKVIRNNGHGKKSALRTGAEAAGSDLIIVTDADCRLNRKWISTIAAFYDKNKPDLIIGPVTIECKPGFPGRFQELEFLSLQAVTAGTAAAGDPVMCNGASLAFTYQTWRKHNASLKQEIPSGDDMFLLHSVKKEKDSRILWLESQDAVVRTKPAPSFSSFLKQRARWISKYPGYDDRYTRIIAIVTFVTIMEMLFLTAAGIINTFFLELAGIILIIKSLADFIILAEITRRRKRQSLLLWLIPSQLIYPFYVLAVSSFSLFRKKTW